MVHDETVKKSDPAHWRWSRRQFLGAAAAGTFGLLSGTDHALGQSAQTTRPAARRYEPVPPPWWLARDRLCSRVVDIHSQKTQPVGMVGENTMGGMLDQGIQNLTEATTAEAGWRTVLGSAERIVLKFNNVGAGTLGTNNALARLLVERLGSAGYTPDKIALAEVPDFMGEQLGTRPLERGWGSEIGVGGQSEPLAQYVCDADALINVPFLKTHQIAGMSGCLKNLSHAVIRHPAHYHANGCSPYVAQVVGSKEVSSKLRLNVVNAIRIVVNGGPDARHEDVVDYGGLLLGFDPVAIDNVGHSILTMERRRLGLPATLQVPYLSAAAEMRLGRWRPGDIELTPLETGA